MRIEYELTEDEYVEASLASHLPMPAAESRKLRRRRLSAMLVCAGLIAAALAMTAPTWIAMTRRALDGGSVDAICVAVGRYEWLTPWLLFSLGAIAVTKSFRQGRRAVRRASILVGLLFVVLLSLAAFAELATSRHLLLGGLGPVRIVPWVICASLLSRLLIRGWSSRPYRKIYERSSYAGGPVSVELDERGVRNELRDVTQLWRWAGLDEVRRTRRLLILTNGNGQAVIVLPTRALGTPDELETLVGILKSRVGAKRTAFAIEPTRPA